MKDQAQDGMALVRWAPRVSREKIRRLYASEARGLTDEVLLDDVSIGVYLRCRIVTTATEALAYGRVGCPRCNQVIQRQTDAPDGRLHCSHCGWTVAWEDYRDSIRHRHLIWGGAFLAVKAFITGFNGARVPRDKMLLLDRFIHACHWEMTHYAGRPAAMLVIEGKEKEVVELIETLAYADNCPPELRASRAAWQNKRQPQALPPDARPWKEELGLVWDGYVQEADEFTRSLHGRHNATEKQEGTREGG